VNERRVALSLTDSRRQDADPVTYVARMSKQTTTIDRLLESQHTDAEVSATTQDWKACVIGGVPLERLSNVRVCGSDDAVRQLIDTTSLKDSPGATSDAEA
jgi:hypothetical protein